MSKKQLDYEIDLGSFDREMRNSALHKLNELLKSDEVSIVPELPIVNLHCHTFFSFNAYYYSPSAFAWEAKKRGLYAAGIIDFDVLDGVEEFLDACSVLEMRATAGIESRVYIDEWKDREINSPKEPGIYYSMGYGFTDISEGSTDAQRILQCMTSMARRRNEVMLEKLNDYLRDVVINYEEEVLPLTPSGNATERHMLVAIDEKSKKVFPEREKRVRFWSNALGASEQKIRGLIDTPVELQMLIRSKLMKHGGPGYSLPDKENFPALEEMIAMIRGFGAVPTAGWLDGTSKGEKNSRAFLDFMVEKGAACLAIIPDRNWNIQDKEERRIKIGKLNEIVESARLMHLPIVVGTEMNKNGQKFVDDFHTDALKPFQEEFLNGARIMNGHTLLSTVLGFGLKSEQVTERFRADLDARNRFFEEIGKLKPSADHTVRKELEQKIKQLWEKT